MAVVTDYSKKITLAIGDMVDETSQGGSLWDYLPGGWRVLLIPPGDAYPDSRNPPANALGRFASAEETLRLDAPYATGSEIGVNRYDPNAFIRQVADVPGNTPLGTTPQILTETFGLGGVSGSIDHSVGGIPQAPSQTGGNDTRTTAPANVSMSKIESWARANPILAGVIVVVLAFVFGRIAKAS